MNRSPVLLLVGVLIVALVVPALPLVAGDVQRVNMDADNPLATDDAVTEYEDTGAVSRNLTRYDMQFAYYDDADQLSWFNPSRAAEASHEWLVVCYNEEIPREIRFYVPETYFTPVTDEGIQSRTGTATASFTPTAERNHTAIVVKFSGPGCHAFGVNTADSFVFGHVESAKSRVEDFAGVDWDIPGLSGGEQWSHINSDRLDNQTAVGINASSDEVTVQYRTTVKGEERWIAVPDTEKDGQPVYLLVKDGEPGKTYVVSTVSDAPQVLYMDGGAGVGTRVRGAINDIFAGGQAFWDDLTPNI